ncbi:hypothetical protein TrRE_jg257 [Triparma retinervis]|uniref:J domain-containing protein n=1 Tax=Triparma retinervis TaxID=2557542 RepID=A0A9W6ZK13_9STRA|nr:hypothetical protein TrRE_jg257 [Triparma retinervis]
MRHHPDVGSEKCPETFARVQKAYESVMSKDDGVGGDKGRDDEFSWKLWRKGDVIAMGRKDVAGEKRRRPARPVGLSTAKMIDFKGGSNVPGGRARGEILGDGKEGEKRVLSSVARGKSKWTPKEKTVYKGWDKGGGRGGGAA